MKKFKVVTAYTSQDTHIVEAKSAEEAKELIASGEFSEGMVLEGDDAYLISVETDPKRSYMDEQVVLVEEIEEKSNESQIYSRTTSATSARYYDG